MFVCSINRMFSTIVFCIRLSIIFFFFFFMVDVCLIDQSSVLYDYCSSSSLFVDNFFLFVNDVCLFDQSNVLYGCSFSLCSAFTWIKIRWFLSDNFWRYRINLNQIVMLCWIIPYSITGIVVSRWLLDFRIKITCGSSIEKNTSLDSRTIEIFEKIEIIHQRMRNIWKSMSLLTNKCIKSMEMIRIHIESKEQKEYVQEFRQIDYHRRDELDSPYLWYIRKGKEQNRIIRTK